MTSAWDAQDCDGDGATNGKERFRNTDARDLCSFSTDDQIATLISQAWKDDDCDGDSVLNSDELELGTLSGTVFNKPVDLSSGLGSEEHTELLEHACNYDATLFNFALVSIHIYIYIYIYMHT